MRLRIPSPGASRPESKPLMWAGHYAIWFVLAALPVVAYGNWVRGGGGRLETDLLGLPTTVATLAIMSDLLEHRWRLCERCARHTPLDGHAAAARWRWALWLTHSKARWVQLGVLLAWAAWTIAQPRPPWFYWPLNTAVYAAFTVVIAAVRKHHALYAWCPWCDWGGGGEEEPSPEATPSPGLIRS